MRIGVCAPYLDNDICGYNVCNSGSLRNPWVPVNDVPEMRRRKMGVVQETLKPVSPQSPYANDVRTFSV